ncbi:carbohydrate ABC transporter permease [Cohnella thailandensis]|uniref:Sugar ABC transporter permease n=1 Tax=Cohnella thailandensis TaxID=557557 RepID=A0A841SR82_9BACL|nr:sugar ABC transporter permease [Cohnella thailandensis]MBB6634913.1 sugar ABC transporter permease [Cohnella thailandensis]MBP1975865.1 multiple sugar transport system permease protein/raffinose/stachyose/melibiose transport system permease protein [Cohnella thailandensis]
MNRGWNRIVPYLLILPNYLIFAVFVLAPVLWIVYLSFTDYTILQPSEWIGGRNYERLLQDTLFRKAIVNTIWYWIGTIVPTILLGLILAALLTMKIRLLAAFRALIYLPGVLSSVAVAMTWLWLLDPLQGPINGALEAVGIGGRNWLQNPDTSLPSIIVIGVWTGLGYAMIVLLAGIQGIPESLYEAASLDGASGPQRFRFITVPLLKPILLFLFITATIRSFQVFDLVYILTGGGPANSSTTIVTQIVGASFQEYRMGYASSMAVFLLGITLIVTMLQYWLGSRNTTTE